MKSALQDVDDATRTLLEDELVCIADTKLVLGNWFAECVMNGRSLPDFAALLGMCTASYGQTRALYRHLDSLGYSYAHLERGRGPAEIRSMDLLDQPPQDWQDFLVSIWLAEQAVWSMASGFLGNPDRTIAGIARKIGEEAYFHLKWAAGWFRIVAGSPEEKARFTQALERRYPLALRWFGPPDGADGLAGTGMRDDSIDAIREGFTNEVREAVVQVDPDLAGRLGSATFPDDWRPDARRSGPLPQGLFDVIRFKDPELAG